MGSRARFRPGERWQPPGGQHGFFSGFLLGVPGAELGASLGWPGARVGAGEGALGPVREAKPGQSSPGSGKGQRGAGTGERSRQ